MQLDSYGLDYYNNQGVSRCVNKWNPGVNSKGLLITEPWLNIFFLFWTCLPAEGACTRCSRISQILLNILNTGSLTQQQICCVGCAKNHIDSHNILSSIFDQPWRAFIAQIIILKVRTELKICTLLLPYAYSFDTKTMCFSFLQIQKEKILNYGKIHQIKQLLVSTTQITLAIIWKFMAINAVSSLNAHQREMISFAVFLTCLNWHGLL